MRAVLMSTMILALGACGGDKHSGETAAANSTEPNYTAKVLALPEKERQAVFFRAIRDAGLPCQSVTKSEILEPDARGPMWRASCEDGEDHLIQVTAGGTVNIVSRPTPDHN